MREFTKFSRGWESVAGVAGKHVEIEEFRGVVTTRTNCALPDLGSLPLLRDIDLHGNAIERLPEDMSGLRALESLSVQGNRLKKIPKSLTTLRSGTR